MIFTDLRPSCRSWPSWMLEKVPLTRQNDFAPRPARRQRSRSINLPVRGDWVVTRRLISALEDSTLPDEAAADAAPAVVKRGEPTRSHRRLDHGWVDWCPRR